MLWQQVRLAGLSTGATDMTSADWCPINADGNPIGIMAGTNDATKSAVKEKGGNAIREADTLFAQKGYQESMSPN